MNIWNDEVVKRLYYRLSSKERKGLEQAIQVLREVYPKIDIYVSILGGGAAISAGRKSISQSKGKPLFVITRPTTVNPSCIKIRIDSKKDRKDIEDALGRRWKDINSTKFYLDDFPDVSEKLNAFVKKVRSTNASKKRSNGSGYNPSDYNEMVEYPAENEQGLIEGAQKTVTVNKYERNRKARNECIAHHGTRCFFCGFDYGEKYGDAYAGFIHVHHIVPLSKINEKYKVNPQKDLVPVCPNCHAVIHFSGDALALDEAKSILTPHDKGKSPGAKKLRI